MSSPHEKKLLEPYCKGVGINIGCGSRQLGSSIGVDLRSEAKAAIIQADASFLPFNDNSLDYIVSCHCLEHTIFAPLLVIREWLRCLKVGGVLAIMVPDGSEGKVALEYSTKKGRFGEGGHTNLFTVKTLSDIVSFAGTDIIRAEVIDRRPYWKTKCLLLVAKKSTLYVAGESPRSRVLWIKSILKTALPKAYIGSLLRKW